MIYILSLLSFLGAEQNLEITKKKEAPKKIWQNKYFKIGACVVGAGLIISGGYFYFRDNTLSQLKEIAKNYSNVLKTSYSSCVEIGHFTIYYNGVCLKTGKEDQSITGTNHSTLKVVLNISQDNISSDISSDISFEGPLKALTYNNKNLNSDPVTIVHAAMNQLLSQKQNKIGFEEMLEIQKLIKKSSSTMYIMNEYNEEVYLESHILRNLNEWCFVDNIDRKNYKFGADFSNLKLLVNDSEIIFIACQRLKYKLTITKSISALKFFEIISKKEEELNQVQSEEDFKKIFEDLLKNNRIEKERRT